MWSKQTLIIAVLTFCTVALWIIFDVYHIRKTSTIPPELKQQIEPLDPKIDKSVVLGLKDRPEDYEVTQEMLATLSGNITPTVTPANAITPTGTVTVTPTVAVPPTTGVSPTP